jgi:polyribonucleotide 5'-hydroxyl-kinase
MIVGPHDHGKSSVAQILTAYAARLDRTPVYIDLDVGLNTLAIPGCISAAVMDKKCLNVEVIDSLHFD